MAGETALFWNCRTGRHKHKMYVLEEEFFDFRSIVADVEPQWGSARPHLFFSQ